MCVIGRGVLGGLAAWHLPGGPVGPTARWVASKMLKWVKRLNRGRVETEEKEESGDSHKEGKGREGIEYRMGSRGL